uniref:hypothetical protein n=1 Tax=uncultured Draconibacterium sp. TaxID=1573823 RepID=UPI003216BB30
MKKKTDTTGQSVKMNLTLSRDFYQILKEHAYKDYAKPATWTKQFLMKTLLNNKPDFKLLIPNEKFKQ